VLAQSSVPHYVASSHEMHSNPSRHPDLEPLEQSNEFLSSSDYRQTLLQEQRDLRVQAEKKDRQTLSISDMETGLCTELMDLFNVSYVFSPSDAEAQCARLVKDKVADVVFSEDVDTLLFGAPVVRWAMSKKRTPEYYSVETVSAAMKLTREQLLFLALVRGCDYSDGVGERFGMVAAYQLLARFPGPNPVQQLRDFLANPPSRTELSVKDPRRKLLERKDTLPRTFLLEEAYELFMNPPGVEPSQVPFVDRNSVVRPNFRELRSFVARHFSGSHVEAANKILDDQERLLSLNQMPWVDAILPTGQSSIRQYLDVGYLSSLRSAGVRPALLSKAKRAAFEQLNHPGAPTREATKRVRTTGTTRKSSAASSKRKSSAASRKRNGSEASSRRKTRTNKEDINTSAHSDAADQS